MSFFKNLFKEITLLISNGGYHSYYVTGPQLPLKKVREIYINSKTDFVIYRDIFVTNLTLENINNKRVLRVILFLYEYLRLVYMVLKGSNWVFCINDFASNDAYEVCFRSEDLNRNDLIPKNYKELGVYKVQKNDFINSFILILPCFTFNQLYKKRLVWLSRKFRNCNLPNKIIILEGESLEQRALYHYAKTKNIEINIKWNIASNYLYSKEDLLHKKDLDKPVPLIRPTTKNIFNRIEVINKVISIENDLLMVVPADFGEERCINWILKCKNIIKANRYFFSLHPSSKNLIKPIEELGFGKIDFDKINYFTNYDHFAGSFSTLIQNASEQKKNVYSIAFNEIDLEYIDAMMCNIKILNAINYDK